MTGSQDSQFSRLKRSCESLAMRGGITQCRPTSNQLMPVARGKLPPGQHAANAQRRIGVMLAPSACGWLAVDTG
eukprot:1794611-Alexandrium_andersonii.AAC.1